MGNQGSKGQAKTHAKTHAKTQAMRDASFFALAALVSGPAHGYAILQSIRSLSDGDHQVPIATLYGTLDRLDADGYIDVVGEETIDGRARRIFGITDQGRSGLLAEADRREAASKAVRAQIVAATKSDIKKSDTRPRLTKPAVGGAR
jgi:PadR family transcriptional regulator, regulatory protein PadR